MRIYHFPKWLKWNYPNAIWEFTTATKSIYLTFDDGPNPSTTNWILDTLAEYNAKATFFCLGKQVENHPNSFKRILNEGHSIGNHTYNHLNGWKTKTSVYLTDIKQAQTIIPSNLFRPPYGKIKRKQLKKLNALGFRTVFWTHLTYDFDNKLPPQQRIKKMISACKSGAILVFHDSDKAFPQLKNELPLLLKQLQQEGYSFLPIN